MKLLYDFFPILAFFIAFKFSNIFTATAIFIAATMVQMSLFWYWHRRFEAVHWLTFVFGILLGSATLFLHDEIFIKWKPTVVYWLMGGLFLFSTWFGDKPFLQRTLGAQLELPKLIWQRLNLTWGIFFIAMGMTNLFVIYNFSTNTWVDFKLFGLLGLTFVFIFLQLIFLSKYLKINDTPHEQKSIH